MTKKIMIGARWPIAFPAREYDPPDMLLDVDFESEKEYTAYANTVTSFELMQKSVLAKIQDKDKYRLNMYETRR